MVRGESGRQQKFLEIIQEIIDSQRHVMTMAENDGAGQACSRAHWPAVIKSHARKEVVHMYRTRIQLRAGLAPVTIAALIPSAIVLAGGNQFTVQPGWPLIRSGSSVDGGMLVNMDEDAELELVQVAGGATTGSEIYALKLDGSDVPGWPQSISQGTFSAPAFGDIDGDGEEEVVVHSFFFGISGQVWAFNKDGTSVTGFPQSLGGTLKAPALGDVNNDGDLEIISVVNISGIGHVFVLDGDGSVLPGWPQQFDTIVGTGPAVGDVDGNGSNEIFACSFYKIYGYRGDGAVLPGFPFEPGEAYTFNYNTPVLADLDGDGDREIVTATSNENDFTGRAYVLNHDGTVVQGWPQGTPYSIFVPPSVADIDGDGWLDVALGDQTLSPEPVNAIHAWDRAGVELPGFPIDGIAAIFAQIMIADIDGDGAVELICDDNRGGSNLAAYNHDGTPVDGWPLEVLGSSFQQSPSFADIKGNGLMDMTGSGNMTSSSDTSLYMWESELPWDPALVPVPTYQYNVRRDGVVAAGDTTTCPADIDGSGSVDIDDLLILLASWGGTGDADINGDGTVDVTDLLELLAAWGPCPNA
jgi:hypothetical protein